MPTLAKTASGTVTGIWGTAWIRTAEGKLRPLHLGEVVKEGDVVLTEQNSIVQITEPKGEVHLAGKPAEGADGGDLDRVIASLNSGDAQTAPAAGVAAGGGDGSFTPGLRVDRVSEATTAAGAGTTAAPLSTGITVPAFATTATSSTSTGDTTPVTPTNPVQPPSVSVSAPALTNDTTPTLTGTASNVPAGTTVTLLITDSAGALHTVSTPVATNGSYSIELPFTLPEGAFSVAASVTNATTGATASDTSSGLVDVTPPAATLTLGAIATDDVVNAAERGSNVTITGQAGGDAAAGDTVSLSINGKVFTATVGADGSFNLSVPGSDLAADAGRSVQAALTLTDAAGNTSTTSVSRGYGVDTEAHATLTLNPVSVDGVVNGPEAAGTVAVIGTAGGDAKAGDTVTLTINGHTYSGSVAADLSFSVQVNGADLAADASHTVQASIAVTDAAGNSATAVASQAYGVDVGASATLALGSVTTDNILNAAEAGGAVAITGTAGGDAKTGDVVTLTVNGNGYTGAVAANGTFSIDVPGAELKADADHTIQASITVTNAAGNTATQTAAQVYSVDETTTASLTINSVTADNILNAAEVVGTVAITGTAGGDAKTGDIVTLVVNGTNYTGAVAANGTFSIDVPGAELKADSDHAIQASITVTDAAGNTATQTAVHAYSVDETAGATLTLDSVTADNILNATEVGGTVAITGTAGGDAKAGDIVTLTVNGNDYTGTVAANGTFNINVPGAELKADADHTIQASITVTDAAGNTTTQAASQAYSVDETASATLNLDSVTADNILNATEVGGTVAITGTAGGDAKVGDIVTLTVNGTDYTGTVAANGTFNINVPGAELKADADHTIQASITVTDAAGNTATQTAAHAYSVDETASATLTLDPVTADNVLNATEVGGTVAITGTAGGDAKTGDIVTLVVNGTNYTGAVAANGTFSIDVPGAELKADSDHAIQASITVTDAAGNAATQTAVHAYSVDETASATLNLDPVTADNVLNATEVGGTVAITGTAGGDAKTGDIVTLTVNGTDYTGTVAANGTFSVNVPGAELKADADHTIQASITVTDAAGNTATQTAAHAYSVDETAGATLNLDSVTADNVLNATEVGGTVAITGTAGGDAKTGDVVTLTVNGTDYTGTVAANGTFNINVPGAELKADADHTIQASITVIDAAGNTATQTASHAYSVDETAAATLTVDSVTTDNILNAAEVGGTVAITGTAGGDAKAGDIVTLTVNGTDYTGTVATNGTFSINVPGAELKADADHTIQASITVTDAAGNAATQTAAQAYSVDETASATLTLDSVTADNVLNATEVGGTVAITGTAGGDAKTGDIVTLTVNGNDYTGTVAANGTFSINVPGAELKADADHTIQASITVTDAAGNAATQTAAHAYSVDETASATLTLDPVTADNVLNATEVGGTVAITGTAGGDAKAGDIVTLTVNGTDYTGTVAANGTFSVNVPGAELKADADHTIQASITVIDAAGNAATQTAAQAYSVDETASATLTLDPVTADNVLNATEVGGTVAITGTAGGDTKTGDIVTLTVNGTDYTGTVAANGTFSVNVPGTELKADADHTIQASITVTDAAGNTATQTAAQAYSVDETASATLTLDPVTADNVLNATELGGTVAITGTAGGDAKAGDIVTLTVNGTDYTGTVAANGTFSINVPGAELKADADHTIQASITVIDAAGNAATQTAAQAYSVDETASATLTLDSVTADNVLNATEVGGTVAITGTAGGDAKTGDIVTLTVNGTDYTGTVAANGTFSVNVPGGQLKADADHTVQASITVTDAAGNTATQTAAHAYSVDETASATLTLDPVTADNVLNATEVGGTVAITGTAGGDAKTGDVVTLTVNGNDYTGTVAANGTFSINIAGAELMADADHAIQASITVTDAAGNAATQAAAHAYSVDETASATLNLDPVTADNVLNATEVGGTVAITGTAGGDAKTGDVVTLTVNGTDYTGTVAANGTFNINVPGAELKADADHTIQASITVTDAAGNTATQTAAQAYSVDETAGATLTLDSVTADNILNATEVGGTVAITGTAGGDAKTGDVVTLTVNGTDYTGTVAANGTFSVNIPGAELKADADHTIQASITVTDAAGNTATQAASQAYSVDETASATLTLDPVTADNVLNAAEVGGTVAITGTAGGDAKVGDIVTLTVNGNDYTGTVATNGTFSINIAGAELKADADHTIQASITVTDAAGNTATQTAAQTYTVDLAADAKLTIDAVTADNVLNAVEAAGIVTITGSAGGDAKAGDIVSLTINGNTYSGALAAGGSFSIDVAGSDLQADADRTIDAAITVTDAAGNTATVAATQSYGIAGGANATLSVDAITADNIVNAAEAGGTVTVTGQATGDAKNGDVVTLTVNGNAYTGSINAGGAFSIAVAGSDLQADAAHTVHAAITVSNAAGNSFTANSAHSYAVDLAAAATLSVDPVTADNILNTTEAAGTVAITGNAGGDAKAGDLVTLSVNGQTYTGTLAADRSFSIDVAGADLAADADHRVDASIAVTDAAGNTATQAASVTYAVNHAPLAVADTASVGEDSASVAGTAMPGTAGQDSDADGDSLTVIGVAAGTLASATGNVGTSVAGTWGTLQLQADGTYSYTPSAGAQALKGGETVNDVFTYTITDGHGDSASATLTIQVVGANDVPTITGQLTGTATEDVTFTAVGSLSASDADAGESGFVAQTNTAGVYGSLSLTTDGHWTYTLNNGAANVQSLTGTDTVTDSFTVTTADGTQRTVVVTVNGTNDTATISGTGTGSVTEDTNVSAGTISTSGDLAVADVDQGQAVFQTQSNVAGANGYGSFSIDAAGHWTYTANNSQAAIQQLGAGQSLTDSIVVKSADGTASQTITVTIDGTNDAATISGTSAGSVTEDTSVSGSNISTSGDLTVADVDQGQSVFQTQSNVAGSNGYGSFSIDAAGHWTYTASNSQTAIQQLGAGQSLTDSIVVKSADGTASQTISVTINGTNDAATISGTSTGSVTEDTNVSAGTISTSGDLTVADVDQGQAVFQTQSNVAGSNGYGSFNIDAAGHWTYTANNGQTAIQQLGAGQSLTDSIVVKSADGTASQTITVTINGTNDAATISGAGAGSVTEDTSVSGGNISTSGDLAVADVDQGQSLFQPQSNVAGSNGHGSFSIDAAGHWTYTASNSQAAIQQLGAGQSLTDSIVVKSADGTASQTITVTINGTNDTATISGTSTSSVTEDTNVSAGNISTSGTLTVADVDQGQAVFQTQSTAAGSNGYGSFSIDAAGHWTYTANNSQAAIQQLGAGQSLTDSIVVKSADGTASQTITVTINGTNDAATISGTNTGSVTEDTSVVAGNLSTSGTLAVADVDQGQAVFQTQSNAAGANGYGSFSIDAAGHWTYTANNSQAAIQQLGAGQSLTDSIVVKSADGTASQTITITLTGTNDMPVAVADVGSVNGDAASLTGNVITGPGTDTDIDTGDVLSISALRFGNTAGTVGSALAGNYGTLTLNANGSYTYVPNAAALAMSAGTSAVDTFNYTVSDGHGGLAFTTLSITVNGTNHVPTLAPATLTGTEDTPRVFTLADFGYSDADGNALQSLTIKTLPADGTIQQFNGSSWVGVSANQSVSAATISAGNLRFVPDANESGSSVYATVGMGDQKHDYAQFSVVAVDSRGGSSTAASVTVDIAPVADAPTLNLSSTLPAQGAANAVPLAPSTGLQQSYYQASSSMSPANAGTAINLETGLNSETPTSTTLVAQVATPSAQTSIAQDDAYRVTGLIYLEAGHNYTVSGYRDDTMQVEIGGTPVYSVGFNNWGSFTATAYTPTASGYYTFEVYVYNGDGAGAFGLQMSVDGATAQSINTTNFKLYPDIATVDAAGAQHDALVGTSDGGYYPVTLNSGYEDTSIRLSIVAATPNDTDGSEVLSVKISSVPVGAMLSDGTHTFTATAGSTTADVTGWNMDRLAIKPPTDFSGSIALGVTATSTESATGGTATTSQNLTVTVLPANDLPVAVNDSFNGTEDTTLSGSVAGNDSAVDGGAAYSLVSGPANGTLTFNADGSFSFAPNANWNGTTTFTYSLKDGLGSETSTATVTLNIAAVNDPPVVVADSYATTEGGITTFSTVMANDSDVDGDAITVKQFAASTSGASAVAANGLNTITTALGGTVIMNADGTYRYIAPVLTHNAANTPQNDSFAYRVTDGTANSSWTTVTIAVGDSAPKAGDDSATVTFNGSVSGNVLANDIGADGPLSVTKVVYGGSTLNLSAANPSGTLTTADGTLTIGNDGNYTFQSQIGQTRVVTGSSLATWEASSDLYGFDASHANGWRLSGSTTALDPSKLDSTAQGRATYVSGSKDGIGVSGNGNTLGTGEELIVKMLETTNHATVGIAQLNTGQQPSSANWFVYSASGAEVAHGTFASATSNSNGSEYTLALDTGSTQFQYIRIDWTDSSQGIVLSSLDETRLTANHTPVFTYTTADTDGDTASATLSVANSTSTVTPSTVIEGSSSADTLAGSNNADTINGYAGDDALRGYAGDDTLNGGDGNDYLHGGAGNDTINGGNGADVIYGGAGSDTLSGGAGADVFAWALADKGSTGTPAVDTITDFNVATPASGGDQLDLRDLLQGETNATLDKYLEFDTSSTPGSTVIHISSSGAFAAGSGWQSSHAGSEDQRIVLSGVNLPTALGLSSSATDLQIIQELLNRGKLLTDTPPGG